MFESSKAVTTSYPPYYHDSNTLVPSSNSVNRTTPVKSKSVDLDCFSNQCPPIMSSAQQQRLTKHTSFDQPGLSPHGQASDSSRNTDNYGSVKRNDSMTNSGHFWLYCAPDKRNCSVFSLANERYKLDASSYKDHENEDDSLIFPNSNSLCMCVFDGHDGSRAVQYVRQYMKGNIFDTKSWMKLSEFNHHEEMESALAEFFRVTDKDFFKSIKQYIDEKIYLQSQIPKVILYVDPFQINNINNAFIINGCVD